MNRKRIGLFLLDVIAYLILGGTLMALGYFLGGVWFK